MNVVLFGDVLAGRDRPAVEIHSTSPRVTFTPPPLLFFCVLFFQFSVQQTAFPLIVPHVWMHSHPVQLRSPEIEEGGVIELSVAMSEMSGVLCCRDGCRPS